MRIVDYERAIAESEEELLALEQRHRGKRTSARVQVLRLLKSGRVKTVRAAAPVVGYTERQVQEWWRRYRTGGLTALLDWRPPLGKRSRLTEEAYAGLAKEMAAGKIATLREAQGYLSQEWGIVYRSLNGVWRQLRKRRVKLKTGRRRHRKADEEEQEAYKQNFDQELGWQEVVRVWAFDEGRFGLKVWFRRRWCPLGVRPPWIVDDRYEWLWLYAAVEPAQGDSFFLLMPRVDSQCLQLFVDGLSAYLQGERVGLVVDGSGSHGSGAVRWPEHVVRLPLPSYSPELNPAEAIFRAVRAELSNLVFEDLAELEEALCEALRPFWEKPEQLRSLIAYPWWIEGINANTKLAS